MFCMYTTWAIALVAEMMSTRHNDGKQSKACIYWNEQEEIIFKFELLHWSLRGSYSLLFLCQISRTGRGIRIKLLSKAATKNGFRALRHHAPPPLLLGRYPMVSAWSVWYGRPFSKLDISIRKQISMDRCFAPNEALETSGKTSTDEPL